VSKARCKFGRFGAPVSIQILSEPVYRTRLILRWMLREAVMCGLLLGARGVALQPALQWPCEDTDVLTPAALAAYRTLKRRLMGQANDASKIVDEWKETKALADQLKHQDLIDIVEYCAKVDSFPPRGVLSPDVMGRFSESLSLAWKPLEYLSLVTRHYTANGVLFSDVKRWGESRSGTSVPGRVSAGRHQS
jgi:hypothetical protein